MKLVGALIVIGLLYLPTPALADRYETTRLYNHKAWSVELTYDQLDDDFWCNAETTNRAGQMFSITAYDNGNLGLFIFDRRWDITPRDIEFRIDIDYSRWNVSGQAQESYVSTFLGDPESSIKFLTELAEGSAVAVFNNDGRTLAVHSLSGSSASLRKLLECWNRIKKTDPFGASPNASAPKSDPF